jgi:menaquinol-cytochrome c reductase iron-sulfur subunit
MPEDDVILPSEPLRDGRRRFLKAAIGVLGGLLATVAGAPLAASLLGPMYRKQETVSAKVGRLDSFPIGHPTNVSLQQKTTDAFVHETVLHDIWVVRRSEADLQVFSPICPHLGCDCHWDPQTAHFVCPCHASVFAMTGEVLAGPSPRPLDTLPYKIENGDLYVEWVWFEPGIAKKVRL